jgi:hypothetical protein
MSWTAPGAADSNFAAKLERAIKIARGEPLMIDREAERIGEVDR